MCVCVPLYERSERVRYPRMKELNDKDKWMSIDIVLTGYRERTWTTTLAGPGENRVERKINRYRRKYRGAKIKKKEKK